VSLLSALGFKNAALAKITPANGGFLTSLLLSRRFDAA